MRWSLFSSDLLGSSACLHTVSLSLRYKSCLTLNSFKWMCKCLELATDAILWTNCFPFGRCCSTLTLSDQVGAWFLSVELLQWKEDLLEDEQQTGVARFGQWYYENNLKGGIKVLPTGQIRSRKRNLSTGGKLFGTETSRNNFIQPFCALPLWVIAGRSRRDVSILCL